MQLASDAMAARSGSSSPSRVVIGGFAGATLVGIYFVLSDLLFGWHTNEVFAAQSIIDYRNFVRMRLRPRRQHSRVYPIGLREVPRKWRFALKREPLRPVLRAGRSGA